jgi:hypothetical protein
MDTGILRIFQYIHLNPRRLVLRGRRIILWMYANIESYIIPDEAAYLALPRCCGAPDRIGLGC